MKLFSRFALSCVLMATALGSAAPRPPQQNASSTITLTVKTVDNVKGEIGVENAQVKICQRDCSAKNPQVMGEGSTDFDGVVKITPKSGPRGSFYVDVRATGFNPYRGLYDVGSGPINLTPVGFTLTLTVRNEKTGDAVQGASVQVSESEYSDKWGYYYKWGGITDANGVAKVNGQLFPTSFYVDVQAPGFKRYPQFTILPQPDQEIQKSIKLTLDPSAPQGSGAQGLGGDLTIHVTFQDGDQAKPLPDATVTLTRSTLTTGLFSQTGRTDANGYVTIHIPQDGNYDVLISHDGYKQVEQTRSLSLDALPNPAEFQLESSGGPSTASQPPPDQGSSANVSRTIEVTVKGKDPKLGERPIPGATVTVSGGANGQTDRNGQVTLQHKVPVGESLNVSAIADGYQPMSTPVIVGGRQKFGGGSGYYADDLATVVLTPIPPATPAVLDVTIGVVDQAGNDLPGVHVDLRVSGNFVPALTGQITGPQGSVTYHIDQSSEVDMATVRQNLSAHVTQVLSDGKTLGPCGRREEQIPPDFLKGTEASYSIALSCSKSVVVLVEAKGDPPQPVPNASVTLTLNNGAKYASQLTDQQGQAQFPLMESGGIKLFSGLFVEVKGASVTVDGKKQSCEPFGEWMSSDFLQGTDNPLRYTIGLNCGISGGYERGYVRVHVNGRAPDGTVSALPQANVSVYVDSPSGGKPGEGSTTDDKGDVMLWYPNLQDGRALVSASKDGYSRAQAPFTTSHEVSSVTITMDSTDLGSQDDLLKQLAAIKAEAAPLAEMRNKVAELLAKIKDSHAQMKKETAEALSKASEMNAARQRYSEACPKATKLLDTIAANVVAAFQQRDEVETELEETRNLAKECKDQATVDRIRHDYQKAVADYRETESLYRATYSQAVDLLKERGEDGQPGLLFTVTLAGDEFKNRSGDVIRLCGDVDKLGGTISSSASAEKNLRFRLVASLSELENRARLLHDKAATGRAMSREIAAAFDDVFAFLTSIQPPEELSDSTWVVTQGSCQSAKDTATKMAADYEQNTECRTLLARANDLKSQGDDMHTSLYLLDLTLKQNVDLLAKASQCEAALKLDCETGQKRVREMLQQGEFDQPVDIINQLKARGCDVAALQGDYDAAKARLQQLLQAAQNAWNSTDSTCDYRGALDAATALQNEFPNYWWLNENFSKIQAAAKEQADVEQSLQTAQQAEAAGNYDAAEKAFAAAASLADLPCLKAKVTRLKAEYDSRRRQALLGSLDALRARIEQLVALSNQIKQAAAAARRPADSSITGLMYTLRGYYSQMTDFRLDCNNAAELRQRIESARSDLASNRSSLGADLDTILKKAQSCTRADATDVQSKYSNASTIMAGLRQEKQKAASYNQELQAVVAGLKSKLAIPGQAKQVADQIAKLAAASSDAYDATQADLTHVQMMLNDLTSGIASARADLDALPTSTLAIVYPDIAQQVDSLRASLDSAEINPDSLDMAGILKAAEQQKAANDVLNQEAQSLQAGCQVTCGDTSTEDDALAEINSALSELEGKLSQAADANQKATQCLATLNVAGSDPPPFLTNSTVVGAPPFVSNSRVPPRTDNSTPPSEPSQPDNPNPPPPPPPTVYVPPPPPWSPPPTWPNISGTWYHGPAPSYVTQDASGGVVFSDPTGRLMPVRAHFIDPYTLVTDDYYQRRIVVGRNTLDWGGGWILRRVPTRDTTTQVPPTQPPPTQPPPRTPPPTQPPRQVPPPTYTPPPQTQPPSSPTPTGPPLRLPDISGRWRDANGIVRAFSQSGNRMSGVADYVYARHKYHEQWSGTLEFTGDPSYAGTNVILRADVHLFIDGQDAGGGAPRNSYLIGLGRDPHPTRLADAYRSIDLARVQ